MRRTAIFLAFICICLRAGAVDVLFDLHAPYFNANPATNRVLTVQPLTPIPGNIWTYTSDTSGLVWSSNMFVGDYVCKIAPKAGALGLNFQISILDTNTATLYAQNITTVLGVQTYPSTGRAAWTIQAADNRYAGTLAMSNLQYQVDSIVVGTAFVATNDPTWLLLAADNGGFLTNLDGTKIQAGTVNSNALDTATKAMLGAGGGGGTFDFLSLSNRPAYQPGTANLTNATYIVTNYPSQFTGTNQFQTNLVAQTATNTALQTQITTAWTSAGISTNVSDALAYIATNNITDTTAQRDLIGAENEFNAIGQWSNVVDMVILAKRFAATNLLSFKLRPMTQTNVIWTNWGGRFNGNAWINLPSLPDSRTNTLVIIWRPYDVNIQPQGMLAGMFSPTTSNGWWYGLKELTGNQDKIGYRSAATNVWSEVPSAGLTNLPCLDYGWNYTYDTRFRFGQRRLTALSVSGNNLRTWDASSAGESKIGYSWNNTFDQTGTGGTNADSTISDSLTTLRIGYGVQPVCSVIDGYVTAEVAAVFLVKGNADTNLIRACFRAADWLDSDTQKNVYVTDSLGLSDVSFWPYSSTNSYVWFLQNKPSQQLAAKNTFRWFSFSGATTANWVTQHAFDFLFRDGVVSKISRARLVVGLGVNDNYNGLTAGATSFANATNLAYVARTNGYDTSWNLENDISHTNTAIFTWTTAGYGRWTNFNTLMLTNWYLFNGFIRSDLLLDQTLMNNTNYSADGVHFHTTNGPVVWQAIANSWLGDNDYGFSRAFPSFSGNVITTGTNTAAVFSGAYTGDAGGATNLLHSSTVGSADLSITVTRTKNSDGSTNFDLSASGGSGTNSTYLTAGTSITITTNGASNFTVGITTNSFDTNGAAAAYTAALARTNGAVNLLDYGAVAGGADCYSALTNAIGSGGHAVIVPVGRYRLGQTVAVPTNTVLVAADYVNSVFYSTNNTQMFLVNSGCSNITCIGVTFEGNWAGTTQYGFQTGVPNSANISFFNCTFRNLSRGLQFENLYTIGGQPYYQGSFVDACRFFNCSVAGLYINGGEEYVTVTGCHSYSNALGLVVYGGNNNVVANDFTANITNVYYKAVPLGNTDHANFKGNSVNHATSGVGLVLEPIRYSMQFEGNYFYDTTNFLSGTNVTFSNNTFVVPGNTNVVTLNLTNAYNMRFINNAFPDGPPNLVATNSNWYEEGLDSTNGLFLKHNGTLVFRFDTTGILYANGNGVTNIPIGSVLGLTATNLTYDAAIATNAINIAAVSNATYAIQSLTNRVGVRLNSLEANTNVLNTRVGLLEGATNSLNTTVSSHSGSITALNNLTNGTANSITALNNLTNQYALLNGATNSLNTRVGLTEGATNNLSTRVGLLESATNAIAPTSFSIATGSQASSGNATNYSITLLSGELAQTINIYLGNTNAYLTFGGTNTTDKGRHVVFWGLTNSVNSTISFNLPSYHTNSTFSATVSNGWCASFYFWNPDTSGTNVFVTDQGRWK